MDYSKDPMLQTHMHTNTGHYDLNEEKFPSKEKSEWRDLPFLVLFALHFAGIGVILGLGLTSPDVPVHDRIFDFSTQWLEVLAIMAGVGFLFSLVYLQLMKAFPTAMIYLGMAVGMALFLAQAIYCFTIQQYVIGAVLAIFTLFFGLYLFLVRARIPFAVEMITTAVGIVQNYPGTQVTAYVSLIVQIIWGSLWTFTLYQASTMEQTASIIMFTFLIFSFYWVSEVIKNVVHVTISGIVATWYFLQNTPAMPESPTYGALNRAMTTSFGSICLGSLIVAIIKTLRALARNAGRNGGILGCVASCILACLENLVRYFNHYAFCQVAIYGKTFCTAASDTWELIKRSGIAAIANDNIIGGVLLVGCLFGAVVVGGVGALMSLVWVDLGSPIVLFFVGALIGFVMLNLTMQIVDSAIACTFVCFAENPQVLRDTNPTLYNRFVEADQLVS